MTAVTGRESDERTAYDAGAEAARLWHELWDILEDDVPTLAVGSYPPYGKVKAFETRIRRELDRAFAAGAATRRA
jgi:hypothetical protein